MDREKVIKGLECCMSDSSECYEPSNGKCPYYKDDVSTSACTDDLFYDVYALLKAQEPLTVICSHDYTEGIIYRCPKCKDKVYKYNGNYCAHCGQAVKWE